MITNWFFLKFPQFNMSTEIEIIRQLVRALTIRRPAPLVVCGNVVRQKVVLALVTCIFFEFFWNFISGKFLKTSKDQLTKCFHMETFFQVHISLKADIWNYTLSVVATKQQIRPSVRQSKTSWFAGFFFLLAWLRLILTWMCFFSLFTTFVFVNSRLSSISINLNDFLIP